MVILCHTSARTAELTAPNLDRSGLSSEVIELPNAVLTACARIEDRLNKLGTSGELVSQFFERLTLTSSAGHTIFGTKPLTELLIRTTSTTRPTEHIPEHAEWSAWLKALNPSFLSATMTVRKTNEHFVLNSPDGTPTTCSRLLVYNQKNIAHLADRYRSDINRAMGREFSAPEIVAHLNSDQGFAIIKENHELLGLLYGFGARNSQTFGRLMQLREISPDAFPHPQQRSHLASETLGISRSLSLIAQLDSNGLRARNGVNFKGIRGSEETMALHREYQATVNQMETLSRCGLLAQAALARWTGLLTV